MKLSNGIYALAAASLLAACSSTPHWTLRGEIPTDEPVDVVIESLTFNGWQPIDTVTTEASGKFEYEGVPKGYPDIYRLALPGGETAYFPIDSLETISIVKSGDSWRLAGSSSASIITSADSLVNACIASNGVEATLNDSILKRELATILLNDPKSVGAYYIVNKRIGGKSIFDPAKKHDLRMIGAVANAYTASRPDDPRTREISNIYMAGRRATMSVFRSDTLVAEEIGHHELLLYDNKGQQRSLNKVVDDNRLTLLNFTVYGANESPAFNILLNDVYKRHHDAGFEIYQVSVDPDETTWRRAAEALPWITVYSSPVSESANLMKYNVSQIPTSFLINRDGEILERIDDVADISAAVKRHM